MTKKLLPFGIHPYAWGLTGKARDKAKAEYELTGYELQKQLLDLDKDLYTDKEYTSKYADLQFKYDKITKLEHLRVLANIIENEEQKTLALLELDYKEHKLTEQQYQKQLATINKEPWVTVVNMDFGGDKSLEGSFELDWNEYFVKNLESDGYLGPTPDHIVNQWFMTVCKNVALEEFDGTGDFTSDAEANLETVKRWNAEYIDTNRKGYK